MRHEKEKESTSASVNGNGLQRNGNGNGNGGNYLEDEANDIAVSGTTHKCYYEGQIFEDGSQWKAVHHDCQMCYCQVSQTFKS